MDLATMLIVLLFRGGDAGHFAVPKRNMAACRSLLESEFHGHGSRTSQSGEPDYAVYAICVPASPRLFNAPSRKTGEEGRAPCGHGALRTSTTARAGTLYLRWTGTISNPLYKSIALQFEKAKQGVRTVLLQISSCGGDRAEMERTISLLRHIKKTHTLETIVDRGEICASACIAIFLQGQRRWGALTSSWLFHEVWHWADKSRNEARVDRVVTERLFQDYYLPAGVSEKWLGHLRIMIQHSDYWQTGENLWEDNSGIITDPLENLVPRDVMQQRF